MISAVKTINGPSRTARLQRLLGTVRFSVQAPVSGDRLQIIFVHGGSGRLESAERSHSLHAGSVCFTRKAFQLWGEMLGGWWLTVDDDELWQAGLADGARPAPCPRLLAGSYSMAHDDSVRCRTFFESLDFELSLESERDAGAERALLHLILVACARGARAIAPTLNRRRGADRLAQQVLGVIDRRYREQLSLAQVAHELSRSPASVARAARDATGCSVVELITQRRLREARSLLIDSDLPVGEIAARVGYSSPRHFHRAFRRSAGTTPHRWRAQAPAAFS